MKGERLKQLVSFEAYKLSSSIVILSPFIPMLFMGDEYGETAPFQYFISHSDPDLIAAVRRGRKEEFAAFRWQGEPPDAQDEKTFWNSKLDHRLKDNPSHRTLLAFHKELIGLRKNLPALRRLSKDKMDVVSVEEQRVLVVRRWHGDSEALAVFNFCDQAVERFRNIPFGAWRKRFDSSDKRWMGPGAVALDLIETPHDELTLQPHGVLLYEKQIEE
jgi:maltooligosyltrehalose trehalohydrolase